MRRTIVLVMMLVILLVIFSIFRTSLGTEDVKLGKFSSFSSSPSGWLGAYLFLKSRGWRVERIEEFFTLPSGGVLIVVEPTIDFEEGEVERVVRFIKGGGVLVLLCQTRNRLMDAFDIEIEMMPEKIESATPLLPVKLTEWVREVRMSTSFEVVTGGKRGVIPIYGNRDSVFVIGMKIGDGWMIYSPDPLLFSNSSLRNMGNQIFLMNIVQMGLKNGGGISFDEYHTGMKGKKNLITFLKREMGIETLIYVSLLGITLLWVNLLPSSGKDEGDRGYHGTMSEEVEEGALYRLLRNKGDLKSALEILILERLRSEFADLSIKSTHELLRIGEKSGAYHNEKMRRTINLYEKIASENEVSQETAIRYLKEMDEILGKARERKRPWKI